MNTTLEIAGGTLSVPTEDLFRSWLRERLDAPAAQAPVQPKTILQLPMLDDGEVYLGAFVSADGSHQHHTILLPVDHDGAPWDTQMDRAKGEGFDLPNRLELLMMWSTMRKRFQEAAYWSNETHQSDSSYAWCQGFNGGYPDDLHKSTALRAVAVRRSPIQPFTHS